MQKSHNLFFTLFENQLIISLDVEDLIAILKTKDVDCYILSIFLAALIYADDVAILAPSVKGLCTLLDACNDYCIEWDICLNAR